MRAVIIFLAFCLLFPSRSRAEFLLGVGIHENSERTAGYLAGLGVNSARSDFAWRVAEEEKGSLRVAEYWPGYLGKLSQSGIVPMLILDYGNQFYDNGGKPVTPGGIEAFARFARFAAKELPGVKHFEVWNEWYHRSTPPSSPESYFNLLRAVAPQIKAVKRDSVVLAVGGMEDGWSEKLVRLGALDYADGLSVHPYVHCYSDARPEAMVDRLIDYSSKLKRANGGREVPLYITEMGWPSHTGACGSSPEKAAQYLARAALLVRTLPEVKGFWWYDLRNDGRNIEEREHNFGLMDFDYRPKPGYYALKELAPVILQGKKFTRVPAPPGVVMVEITSKTGEKTYAVWTEQGDSVKGVLSALPVRGATPAARRVGSAGGGQGSRVTVGSAPLVIKGEKRVTVGAEPSRQEGASIALTGEKSELSLDGTPLLLTGAQSVKIQRILR